MKYLYASNFSVLPGSDIPLPYVPLEPSEVAGVLPDTFRLSLSASPQVQVRASDQIDAVGRIHPVTLAESLFSEDFHWRLPLPKPVRDLASALPTDVRLTLPSERDLCDRRRTYYYLSYDFQRTFYEKVLPAALLRKFRDPDGTLNYYRLNAGVPLPQLEAIQKKHVAEYKADEQTFRRRAVYWQERKIDAEPQRQGERPGEKITRATTHSYWRKCVRRRATRWARSAPSGRSPQTPETIPRSAICTVKPSTHSEPASSRPTRVTKVFEHRRRRKAGKPRRISPCWQSSPVGRGKRRWIWTTWEREISKVTQQGGVARVPEETVLEAMEGDTDEERRAAMSGVDAVYVPGAPPADRTRTKTCLA